MFLGGVFACFSGGGLPAGYCLDALGKKANAFQITSCIATKLSSRLFPFLQLIPFSLIPLVCLHIVSYLTAPQNSCLYRCPTDSALELPPCPIVWQGQPCFNTLPPERSVRVPKTCKDIASFGRLHALLVVVYEIFDILLCFLLLLK